MESMKRIQSHDGRELLAADSGRPSPSGGASQTRVEIQPEERALMKRQRTVLLLLLTVAACVSTQVTHLAGFDPVRPPTCAAVIQVYASAEAVGAPYVELAMLNTSASDPVGNDKLIQNMKEKAATLGANAILLKGFGSQMGGPGLVSSAFVAKPTGQSVAIWVPRDSANIQARCAAADTARAVR